MNEESSSTTPKNTASVPITPTPIPTDDESITTSTESGVFETWTLVKDKHSERKAKMDSKDDDDAKALQQIQSDRTETDPTNPSAAELDSTNEDFSDGISIISESESGGRLSPHPSLREHLSNLNLKYSSGNDDFDRAIFSQSQSQPQLTPSSPTGLCAVTRIEDIDVEPLRQRRKKRSSTNEKNVALQTTVTTTEPQGSAQIRPIVRRGLTVVFYVGVVLAILAFIGKLRYPEWQPLSSNAAFAELEQKLSEIELQNNLMRAEIDILSKQVNYLSGLSGKRGQTGASQPQSQHQYHKSGNERVEKTFKAWSGNGNAMDSATISKSDLKRPYKCVGGDFVEVAGMCIENKPQEQPLVDQIGKVVEDVLQESVPFKTFEKIAENIHAFGENPFENTDEAALGKQGATREQTLKVEQQYMKEPKRSAEILDKYEHSSRERGHGGKYEKKYQHKRKQDYEKHDSDDDDDDESKENFMKRTHNSKERFDKHDKARYDSNWKNSKERNNRKQHKVYPDTSDERRMDKDWHEKLMLHREQARQQNQRQRDDKNWYIKRGDSREHIRQGDKHFR